jgi:hypothetical protein
MYLLFKNEWCRLNGIKFKTDEIVFKGGNRSILLNDTNIREEKRNWH